MTARVASSTSIAWWHKFSAPTSVASQPPGDTSRQNEQADGKPDREAADWPARHAQERQRHGDHGSTRRPPEDGLLPELSFTRVSLMTVSPPLTGTCVIDAKQAGNASYAAAPQVLRTITVTGRQAHP